MPIPPQGGIHRLCDAAAVKSGDPVFIGSPLFVFVGCTLTTFDRICYNKVLGHTENGGRFRFLLPRIAYDGR